jgi:hypothetical protein
MLYKTFRAAVYRIDANIIEVEVDCSGIKTNGDHLHTAGLPDTAAMRSSSGPEIFDRYSKAVPPSRRPPRHSHVACGK